ncbi:MAG: hypothetical protein JEZ12_26645 [Desulfobacterium sp.]|nr:hypothetical protein [Desulfobacterium sp.]
MATQQEIGEHLDLTSRRIRALVKEGVLPSSKGRGGYELDSCRLAYIRYLRGISNGQVIDTDPDGEPREDDYSRLLEKEKYREKKRQNDIEEKKVAPVDVLTRALEKAATIVVPILESLPLLMKRHWPEITGDQIQMVKKAIAEGRNAISDMEIDLDD